MKKAAELYDGRGVFLFTSSTGVYTTKEMGSEPITEEKAEYADNPRIDNIRQAENACLQNGGTVLRLAGLYSVERGPHSAWIKMGKVRGPDSDFISLLSYDDAANAVCDLLHQKGDKVAGQIFHVAEPRPVTRKDICQTALQHPSYSDFTMPEFNNDEKDTRKATGKLINTAKIESLVHWRPKYTSITDYFEAHK